MERPTEPKMALSPDGPLRMAGSNVSYWSDAGGKPIGADISVWMQGKPDRSDRHRWSAAIRWTQDDTIGHYVMTYPNPSGGEYEIHGRDQLQPLVDQALSIGREAVFGSAFVT